MIYDSLKEWWDRQKEFGQALDARFVKVKPESVCLFPGCWERAEWYYLRNRVELPRVPPITDPRVQWNVVFGTCDQHRRMNCVWTAARLREARR